MSDNTVVMLTREGQRVNVPAAEARSRYNSGQFGFPRDEPIAVYDQFVRRQRMVSPEEIGQVINDRVDLLPTLEAGAVRDREAQRAAEAEQRRQMEQEYGDVGSMIGTAAENLVGGATFGLSHGLTDAMSNIPGLESLSREDRMRRAEINPALATGADITGAIAPSIAAIAATGGAAAPAVGAGVAGAAARTGVRAAVGRAAGAAGGALARGAAQYTPAGQLTQFALRQGRAATAAARRGRGAFSPLGRLGPGTAAAAGLATEGAIEGAAAGLGASIRQLANDEAELDSMEFIRAAGENIGLGTAFGAGLGGAAGAVLRNPRVAEWLNDWSDASWLRSTGSPISAVRAESYDGQGAAAIGAMSRRFNMIETGPGADNSLEAIRNRAVVARDEAGQEIGSVMADPVLQQTSLTVRSMEEIDELIREIDRVATPQTREMADQAIEALVGAAPPAVVTREVRGMRPMTPDEAAVETATAQRAFDKSQRDALDAADRRLAGTSPEMEEFAVNVAQRNAAAAEAAAPPVPPLTSGSRNRPVERRRILKERALRRGESEQRRRQLIENQQRIVADIRARRATTQRVRDQQAGRQFDPARAQAREVPNVVEYTWREQAVPKLWGARTSLDRLIYGAGGSPGLTQMARQGVLGAEPMREVLRNARIFASRTIDDSLTAGRQMRALRTWGDQAPIPRELRRDAQGALQNALEKYNTSMALLSMTRGTDPTVFNTVWSAIPWGRLGGMGAVAREAGRSVGARTARATRTPGGKAATAIGAGVGALSGNAVLGGLLSGAIYPIMYRKGQLTGALLSEKMLQAIGLKRQAGVIQDRLRNEILGVKRTFKPKPRAVGAIMAKVSDQMRDYENIARDVRETAANPMPSIDRAREAAPSQLPMAAGASAALSAVEIDLAAQNLPRGVVTPSLISHQINGDALVSDQERSATIRYIDGLKDPYSLVDDIKNGTLSYEKVDAVRESKPQFYAFARNLVIEKIQDGENPLPYEELLALSTMFPDIPVHPSLAPDMIRQSQEPYMARATGSVGGQMSGGGGSSPQPAPNVAQFEKTRVQQLMS